MCLCVWVCGSDHFHSYRITSLEWGLSSKNVLFFMLLLHSFILEFKIWALYHHLKTQQNQTHSLNAFNRNTVWLDAKRSDCYMRNHFHQFCRFKNVWWKSGFMFYVVPLGIKTFCITRENVGKCYIETDECKRIWFSSNTPNSFGHLRKWILHYIHILPDAQNMIVMFGF